MSRAALLVMLVLTTQAPARAAPADEGDAWRVLTLGLLPLRTSPPTEPTHIYAAPSAPDLVALGARLAAALDGRDLVAVTPVQAVLARWQQRRDVAQQLALMDSHRDRGIAHWRALEAQAAIAEFDRGLALAQSAFADILAPERVAELEFNRGLALVELGDVMAARSAFHAMLRLAPERRFERGYYGEGVARALDDALSLGGLTPTLPAEPDRLAALGESLGVDHLLVGTLDRDGTLSLAFFDVRSRRSGPEASIPLGAAQPISADAEEALDRFIARWETCATETQRRIGKPRPADRWAIDLAYRHSAWLKHRRTRDFLHGPGAQLTVTHAARKGLDIWARMAQAATLRDGNGDLLDVFAVTHLAAGVGLNVGDDHIRFLLRASLDLAISLSDVAMTTDVDCKFFGPESPRCRSIFRADSPTIWFGIAFSVGFRYAPTRSWFGVLELGLTSYVLSPSVIDELNFPLYGSLGFGLPF